MSNDGRETYVFRARQHRRELASVVPEAPAAFRAIAMIEARMLPKINAKSATAPVEI